MHATYSISLNYICQTSVKNKYFWNFLRCNLYIKFLTYHSFGINITAMHFITNMRILFHSNRQTTTVIFLGFLKILSFSFQSFWKEKSVLVSSVKTHITLASFVRNIQMLDINLDTLLGRLNLLYTPSSLEWYCRMK